jgi:hypothetical protein
MQRRSALLLQGHFPQLDISLPNKIWKVINILKNNHISIAGSFLPVGTSFLIYFLQIQVSFFIWTLFLFCL